MPEFRWHARVVVEGRDVACLVLEQLLRDDAYPFGVWARSIRTAGPFLVRVAQSSLGIGLDGIEAMTERLDEHRQAQERPRRLDETEPVGVRRSD